MSRLVTVAPKRVYTLAPLEVSTRVSTDSPSLSPMPYEV